MKFQALVVALLVSHAGSLPAQHKPPHPLPHPAGPHPVSCAEMHAKHAEHAKQAGHALHAQHGLGKFEIRFDQQGLESTGVLSISCTNDKLTPTVEIHGQTMALEFVKFEDMAVTLSGGPELTLTLSFKSADEIAGKWLFSGNSGSFTGARQK